MRLTDGQKKTENILYLALWTIMFATPLLSMYLNHIANHDLFYDWNRLWSIWQLLGMFFIAFIIHNHLLAPLLVYQNRRWRYALGALVLFLCMEAYQTYNYPHIHRHGRHPRMEMRDPAPEQPFTQPREGLREQPPFDKDAPRKGHKPPKPPQIIEEQDLISFIIFFLLMGLNIGVKSFFKSLDYRKRMKELEREHLHQQLEYLKFQINPHFFMNTLNNIHALVDFNPEQAKYTIEVLSKLMRYMLYDSNKQTVTLQKELDFISHYIDLMRIRYTDKVSIQVTLPSAVADIKVPPLLFIIFVENAFKHGVSYTQASFINVSIEIDEAEGYIHFLCHNSRKPQAEDTHNGVGLKNAIKRLNLIYGDGYTLVTTPTEHDYLVDMKLPIHFHFNDEQPQ